MPAPNDLSPEDQAFFAEHGLPDLGPGREPLSEENQQPAEQPGEQQPAEQPGEQPQPDNRRPNGQFKSKEELEAEAAAAQPGEQQPQEPKMVPLAALHEARQRAAAAITQAQTLSARMNALLLSQQEARNQATTMPDLNDDPAGYIKALEDRIQQFEQGWSQDSEARQVDQALLQDEQMFKTIAPDYDSASDHYVQSRARELLQFHPPEEAQQIMLTEARQIAKQSWQRGASPAQAVYNLAVARGYVPGQQQAQPGQPQPQGGPRAADAVRAVNNGKGASRSLSGGAGGAAKALNAEAVLSMSDEEFDKYLALGTKGANERFAQIG